jgi:hypothetical protein
MATWHTDWAFSLPLIVLNVVIHVLGLGMINDLIVARMSAGAKLPRHTATFALVLAAATLMVTVLHAFEGTVWALAYRVLGALPDNRSAMLYSLSAITAFGHAPIFLAPHWHDDGSS